MKKSALLAALVLIVAMAALLTACNEPQESELDQLVAMMTGSFSSAAQAAADTNFFDIRLQMKPIWVATTPPEAGRYLYVEQAAGWTLDKPYRQRVYHVTDLGDGVFSSMVYALPDPEAAIGAWKLDFPLSNLSPADLIEREGCAVYLSRQEDGSFMGSTRDKECTSSLRGATYATSEITIGADEVLSWDRGWNDEGEQVWGAEISGYVFKRVETTVAE